MIQQHVWDNLAGHYIDSLAQVANNTTPGTNDTCDQALYALQDVQFNVMAIVDGTGAVVERYEYTLYGQRMLKDEKYAPLSVSAYGVQMGFQGLRHDDETELVDNRTRITIPRLGRFLQRDLHGGLYPDGMNTYAAYHVIYGGVDPSGMLLIAFDGTGNTPDQKHLGKDSPTNVRKFYSAYTGPKAYWKGVGSDPDDWKGKAMGRGAKRKVNGAVALVKRFFEENPDAEKYLDIIGFSRGAAQAIDFSNEVQDELKKCGVEIRFIGVWDTVFSMGLAVGTATQQLDVGFTKTPPAGVPVYHALALDERRSQFQVTRLSNKKNKDNVREVWFPGVHSNVGGGYSDTGISDITLGWMVRHAQNEGVPVKMPEGLKPNALGTIYDSYTDFKNNFPPAVHSLLKTEARRMRPNDFVHVAVLTRAEGSRDYVVRLEAGRAGGSIQPYDKWNGVHDEYE
ncbi:MAG: DUF2235 domain-containing protein [Planctomycetota bacterium]